MKYNHKNILFLLPLLLMVTLPCARAAAGNLRGDINNDNQVNVADVTALIGYVLGNNQAADESQVDVNRDGQVNVADVTDRKSVV